MLDLLHENHHNINLVAGEDLLLYEGVLPLLWIISCTASLSRLSVVRFRTRIIYSRLILVNHLKQNNNHHECILYYNVEHFM